MVCVSCCSCDNKTIFLFLLFCTLSLFLIYFTSHDSLAHVQNSGSTNLLGPKISNFLQFPGRKFKQFPRVFVITPNNPRLTQKADMIRLSQTLQNVKNVHWIVVEDKYRFSDSIRRLLIRSGLNFTHLAKITSQELSHGRGMTQRNFGLEWLRFEYRNRTDVQGVVYFADDDNTYDVRIFEMMRKINKVGVWPTAFTGGAVVETPIVSEGHVTGFDAGFHAGRKFAVDMSGFALNLNLILKSEAKFQPWCLQGFFETCFLEQIGVTMRELEPVGADSREVFVWHTSTKQAGNPPKRLGTKKGFEL